MSVLDTLRESRLFAHFEPEDLERLSTMVRPQEFAAGAELDLGDAGACFVEDGRITLRRATPYGPFVVRRVGAGELLGEARLLKLATSPAEIVIDETLRTLLFDAARLEGLAEASPRFQLSLLWSLWKSLSGKLRRTNERLTGFFTEPGVETSGAPPERGAAAAAVRVDLDAKRGLFAEQRLSSLEINFLTTLSREERYARGQAIFHEGEPARRCTWCSTARCGSASTSPASARRPWRSSSAAPTSARWR